MTTEAITFALILFGLRVLNNAIGTIRLIVMNRQQRGLAAVMAFFEAGLFAYTVANVVTDLTNVLNLFAYCGGFAVGNWLGMALESRFITSYMTVNVITPARGHEIALALREHGFGVTETVGEGRDGKVTMLRSVVTHRDVPRLLDLVRTTHPEAFVAVEEARTVQRGWMRAVRNQQTT